MEIVISIISIIIIITVTILLIYQNIQLNNKVNATIRNVVDQINDSTLYAYKFDKNQDANIKNLDQNVKLMVDNLNNVTKNVKVLERSIDGNGLHNNIVSKTVKTEELSVGANGPFCIGATCINEAQLQRIKRASGA